MLYTVNVGDSVYSIAGRFGISPERIIVDNGLYPPYNLSIGQSLLILIPYITHTVQEGESLSAIAEKYSLSINELYRRNYSLNGNDTIYPGQTIIIEYKDTSDRYPILSNSYAYPFINKQILSSVLPYLSGMIPFTYGFTETGKLIYLDDEKIINASLKHSVVPFLHLSTLTESGVFDNGLSSKLFRNQNSMNNLVDEIYNTIVSKGYFGVDIDFEYIPKYDSESYGNFISTVKNKLAPQGYLTIVALAPKTSDDQKGLLYEGHDYGLIGSIADYILLMTYEWGYAYSRPMAVAPVKNVTDVVEYALSRISENKILLGIPNYGYDWPLPFIDGVTMAKSVGNCEAVRIANEYNSDIKYSKEIGSPFFNYTDKQGIYHEVWFEDPRSINEKFDIVKKYNLAGIGVWNAMREFPAMWLISALNFDISEYNA